MKVTGASQGDLLWLAAVTAVAAGVRAACLQQPISYDEAYTFLNFVARGGSHLFEYPVPNNHVFHTLLARASTVAFGHHLWTMRLPAFVAGVVAVPVTFFLCRKLGNGTAGHLAATAVALYPYLVMYSTVARGYSLIVLLTLVLALAGLHTIEKPSFGRCLALSVIGALGLFTIPTMLFALAGVYLWLTGVMLARGRGHEAVFQTIVPCAFMTAALAALLYVPTIERAGVKALTGNAFVQPLPWATFVARLPAHFHEIARQFSWNIPAICFDICAGLIVIGVIDAARRRDWPIVLLVPSVLAGSTFVLVVKQSIPFVRTWIYMIPLGLIAADVGFAAVIRRGPRIVRVSVAITCILAAGWISREMVMAHTITDAADFPAGAPLVQRLKTVMHEGDAVQVMLPIDWPTYYYLWYYRVPSLPAEAGRPPAEFFIVDKRSYSLREMTAEPATLVVDYETAALYERRGDSER